MKGTYYIILASLCLGVATTLLQGVGITGAPMAGYDPSQVVASINGTAIVDSWNPTVNPFFDIGSGLQFLWSLNLPIIEAFPAMLQASGLPSFIIEAFRIPFRVAMTGLVISFISGRDFMP